MCVETRNSASRLATGHSQLASHYLDAYTAAPSDPDAAEIKSKARETLIRAARRAESLAAHEEAWRYFDRAIELTEDDVQRAGLLACPSADLRTFREGRGRGCPFDGIGWHGDVLIFCHCAQRHQRREGEPDP